MSNRVIKIKMTEASRLFTELEVRVQGVRAPIKMRGDGIWQWGLNVPPCSREEYLARQPWVRSHRSRICWAEWLHDVMEGWHTCVLYAGDEVAILPHHPDYEAVLNVVKMSERPEKEVIEELNNVH